MYQRLVLVLIITSLIQFNIGQVLNDAVVQEHDKNNNSDSEDVSETFNDLIKRNQRTIYLNLVGCAVTMEARCFVDVADDFVQAQKRDIIAEFNREMQLKSAGRSAGNPGESSKLIETIMKSFNELVDMFRENFIEWFQNKRDAKDGEEIVENRTHNETKLQKSKGREVEEARKKKKKGKIAALIKAIVIGVLLFLKIKLLFKLAAAALQFKFFLVALGGLLLNAARFYLDLKKKKEPQKVIYYEHAHHQHHYEGDDDDWHVSGPSHEHEHEHGGYWGRSYETAQDLAYAKQKPENYVRKVAGKDEWSLF